MTRISRRVALLGPMILVATALYGAVGADAAGSFAAHAAAPGDDTSARSAADAAPTERLAT